MFSFFAYARNTPLAVLFLDVDEFESIIDRFGHAVGDMVLVELAVGLGAGVRCEAAVGRIGGDEFVTICANADEHAARTTTPDWAASPRSITT